MNRYLSLLCLGAALSGACASSSSTTVSAAAGPAPQAAPAGFTSHFNGTDAAGWVGMSSADPRQYNDLAPETEDTQRQAEQTAFAAHWRVDAGALVHDGAGPLATTPQRYGDVELQLEYRIGSPASGGAATPGALVHLRGTPVQQWAAAVAKASRPAGQWNTMRIVQVGERTSIEVNGQVVADHERMINSWNPKLPLARVGRIQLGGQGAGAAFRRIHVREIPEDEANRLLATKAANGFASVFNGKDLTGWAGATANYEVVDGTIMCKPKQGGVLHTEKMYRDFVARLEFKLPPGGNNGLAIRYPGKGDTAYVGMTELQILDDTAAQYAKLDPRQYHGSIYGMVAAHRGYQRPVGAWNFEEVTVEGSRIKVELNGTVIVDADVSTVTEFASNRAHPGKDRTEGYFGFAGHSDPVQFRNVQIREIR